MVTAARRCYINQENNKEVLLFLSYYFYKISIFFYQRLLNYLYLFND